MSSRPTRLLTARELAQHLAETTRWIYLQVEQHDLPAYRLGERALRFDLDAVTTWLEARKVGDWEARKCCAKPLSRVPL